MMRLLQVIQDIESYGDDFDDVMTEYMNHGIVYITPESFVICRYYPQDLELFVYYCRGSIKELLKKIDFPVETITFTRKNWTKSYNFQKFISKT